MDTLTRPTSDLRPLSHADRCDRCGAQAFVRATLPAGNELLFCGHHGHAMQAGLTAAGARLHDETASLTPRRESGAAA